MVKVLLKSIHLYASGGHVKKMCKNDSFAMPHSQPSMWKVLSQVTSLCKNVNCTCLRTFQASIGTITIFARRSGSGLVRCTDSITGQSVSGVLGEQLQSGIVTLSTLRALSGVESVHRPELLPELLLKVMMVSVEASSCSCTWFSAHCSILWYF